jgi:IS30 family transposase
MKHYTTFEDRQTIEEMHKGGYNVREIADALNTNISAVYRELHRGFTGKMDNVRRPVYSATQAQQVYKASLKTRGLTRRADRKAVRK